MTKVIIVDYGMGNLGSVQNMFKRIGVTTEVTSDSKKIESAKKILLPGVGAFDTAMRKINETGLAEVLDRKALIDKIPILGICLGMQLLSKYSEEGVCPGLGWIPAQTIKFAFPYSSALKIPHMGWNNIQKINRSKLTENLDNDTRFYFVHSYYVKADNSDDVLATTNYGVEFHSIIQHENIYGAQFHPEKSHRFGMKLLENFAKI